MTARDPWLPGLVALIHRRPELADLAPIGYAAMAREIGA